MPTNLEKLTATCLDLQNPQGREMGMAIMQLIATLAMYLDAYEHDQTEPLASDFAASKGFLAMASGFEYMVSIGIDGGLDRPTLDKALAQLKRLGVGAKS